MIKYFLSFLKGLQLEHKIIYDVNSSDLFEFLFKDTYVYTSPTPNKNNYYVLKFNFSGIATKAKDLDGLEESFKSCVYTGIDEFIKYYTISILQLLE